ncbi:DUF808 family protein [Shigella flexneri]
MYGLVGIIVKLDDIGYWLAEDVANSQSLGIGLLVVAPAMKTLCGRYIGDVFWWVATGVHGNTTPLHHAIEHLAQQQSTLISLMLPTLLEPGVGFIIGGIVVLLVKAVARCGVPALIVTGTGHYAKTPSLSSEGVKVSLYRRQVWSFLSVRKSPPKRVAHV